MRPQVDRPGRGWWRNIIDLYGAADILVAQVQFQRLYPGGPAFARFVGYHGPDKQLVGFVHHLRSGRRKRFAGHAGRAFSAWTAFSPRRSPTAGWFATGASTSLSRRLRRKSSRRRPLTTQGRPWTYQVQIVSSDVNIYNFAMAHLRTTGGVEQVVPVSINPGGVSYVNVTYRGDLSVLARSASSPAAGTSSRTAMCCACHRAGEHRRRCAPPPPQPPAATGSTGTDAAVPAAERR